MWLPISLVGYSFLAVVSVLDKFIVTQKKVAPVTYAFYTGVVTLPLLFVAPFFVDSPQLSTLLFALLGGVCFISGLVSMYVGFERSEVSHLGPFIGATTPLFILLFSNIFLNEIIQGKTLLAIAALVIGSLVIAFGQEKKTDRLGGLPWGLATSFLFSIFHVIIKYSYLQYGFYGGFSLVWGAVGLGALLVLLFPQVRRGLSRSTLPDSTGRAAIIVVGVDKLLSVVGIVLIQYAIFLGSVTLINSLAGVQYALLVILIGLLSAFFPKRFREEYAPGELIQEIVAVVIIGVGLALLIV